MAQQQDTRTVFRVEVLGYSIDQRRLPDGTWEDLDADPDYEEDVFETTHEAEGYAFARQLYDKGMAQAKAW